MNSKTEILFSCSQEGLCSKESAPSVSSISRVLRGGGRADLDQDHHLDHHHDLDHHDPSKPSHSINEILGVYPVICRQDAILLSYRQNTSCKGNTIPCSQLRITIIFVNDLSVFDD